MKFQLAINLERMQHSQDMTEVARHTLEMVQMAEEGGFEIVWSGEHHALEMTIAPNPFQLLTWWASHTSKIRLGTAVVAAAYWHPIRLAGEAAMTDLISGGRLEFGIGTGAYQREFDRMKPGLKQSDAWHYMNEMLPVVRALWAGDYAHDGEYWSFPRSTSVPKPIQSEVPVWVAARAPVTFDYAVKQGCNIMSWPLTRPMSEVKIYMQRLDEALAANPGKKRPKIAMMRHTAIYDTEAQKEVLIRAARHQLGQFANLFRNLDDVKDGFPEGVDLDQLDNSADYAPEALLQNCMFGTPDQAIKKLKLYEQMGVDQFLYFASMGLDLAAQKRSLELFCKEVIPTFQ